MNSVSLAYASDRIKSLNLTNVITIRCQLSDILIYLENNKDNKDQDISNDMDYFRKFHLG
jgi:hypothetical protein